MMSPVNGDGNDADDGVPLQGRRGSLDGSANALRAFPLFDSCKYT